MDSVVDEHRDFLLKFSNNSNSVKQQLFSATRNQLKAINLCIKNFSKLGLCKYLPRPSRDKLRKNYSKSLCKKLEGVGKSQDLNLIEARTVKFVRRVVATFLLNCLKSNICNVLAI